MRCFLFLLVSATFISFVAARMVKSARAEEVCPRSAIGGSVPGATQGRCGFGPRTPALIISPYARQNYVDHPITDQSSVPQFIETNWSLPAIGNGSTDVKAGSLNGMFDFSSGKQAPKLALDPTTGEVVP